MVDLIAALAVFGISTDAIKTLSDIFTDPLKDALKDKTKDEAKHLLEWPKIEAQILGAVRTYAERYTERHGQVKVLGMSEPMSLAKLYTTVCFLDRDNISRYADPAGLEALYRERGGRRLQDGDKRVDGLELANKKRFLMVLGQPGAGKSTFLRRIGLEALKGNKGHYQHRLFPVLLELRRYTDGTLDLAAEIAKELEICGFPEAKGATQHLLAQGRLLVLLDGLDEVPSQQQNTVIDHIQDFVDRYAKNRFIASCRTAAYHSRFRRFTDVVMADFDDGQIQHFIGQWFLSPQDFEANTAERCWEILTAPENAAAKELAQNPLLLTLLCLVFEDGQCFPRNRAVLYGDALDVLLKKWAAEKRIHRDPIYKDLELPLEKVMLGRIAHDFFQADRLFFFRTEVTAAMQEFLTDNLNAPKSLDGDKALKEIEIQQGILAARDQTGEVLSFSHLTFQEYLTAKHLVDDGAWEEMAGKYLTENRWREVFLLAAGLAAPSADRLLLAIAQICRNMVLANPTIAKAFRWTDTIETPDSKFPAAKRISGLALIFVCNLAPTFQLKQGGPDFDTRAVALTLALEREMTKPTPDFRGSLNIAIELVLELKYHLISSPYPIIQLASDKNKLKGHSNNSLIVVQERLEKIFAPDLTFPEELLTACVREVNSILKCLQSHKLLLDCKAAALAVTPATWAEIEAGLFLVDTPPPAP